jgi:hypothetical protein
LFDLALIAMPSDIDDRFLSYGEEGFAGYRAVKDSLRPEWGADVTTVLDCEVGGVKQIEYEYNSMPETLTRRGC